jgi:hypothetical protein
MPGGCRPRTPPAVPSGQGASSWGLPVFLFEREIPVFLFERVRKARLAGRETRWVFLCGGCEILFRVLRLR